MHSQRSWLQDLGLASNRVHNRGHILGCVGLGVLTRGAFLGIISGLRRDRLGRRDIT